MRRSMEAALMAAPLPAQMPRLPMRIHAVNQDRLTNTRKHKRTNLTLEAT